MRRTLSGYGAVAATLLLATSMVDYVVQAHPRPALAMSRDSSTAAGAQPVAPNAPADVAATVNGLDIPLSRVSELSMAMAGPGVLDQLIGNLLADQEAKRQHIQVTPAELDAAIDDVRNQVSPKSLEDAVRERHMTMDVFRDDIRVQVEIRKLLSPKVKPVKLGIEKQAREQQIAAMALKYVASLGDSGKVVVYLGGNTPGPAGVTATVNGEVITVTQVADLALRSAGPAIADRLIDNALIDQEAQKQHVAVTPAEVDARVAGIRDGVKPKALEDVLRENHMTMADLREIQRVRVEAEDLIAKSFPPTKMAHVRHILVLVDKAGANNVSPGAKEHSKSEALAIIAKIQGELKAGKAFADVAKHYSEDPGGKDRGGDLGVITEKSPLDPAFMKAALGLKRGEITSTPVESSYGLHLIEAESSGSDHPVSENALYQTAEDQAKQREVQAEMHDYIPSLRARNHVVNYLAL